jgi:hypothetical protein
MMTSRIFLALIGLIYLYLAVWCSLMPERTSRLVGFELMPGAGQSEFLVIYGGLELAMALIFLLPLLLPRQLLSSLLTCLIIHGCLVLFRSVSFFLYPDIASMVRTLAISEWLIFLGAAVLFWKEITAKEREL